MRASTTDDNEAYSDLDVRIDPFIYVTIRTYTDVQEDSSGQGGRRSSSGLQRLTATRPGRIQTRRM